MDYKIKAQILYDAEKKYVLIETDKPCKPDFIGKLGPKENIIQDACYGYLTLEKGTNIDDLECDIDTFIGSGEGRKVKIGLENLVAVTEL